MYLTWRISLRYTLRLNVLWCVTSFLVYYYSNKNFRVGVEIFIIYYILCNEIQENIIEYNVYLKKIYFTAVSV